MSCPIKIGIIGLDTSHTIHFARAIQGDASPAQRVDGLQVVNVMRFPSLFHSEPDQDKREAQLKSWNIPVTRSFDEAVAGVDAMILAINDPALHLEYFRKVAGLEKPIFLDKPLAGSLVDGREIVALAEKFGTRVWSSSSLRFCDGVLAAKAVIERPEICHVFGALGRAPAGSSLIWYGVHTAEMLVTLMGRGAQRVLARSDPHGVVMIVDFEDGRRGVIECNQGNWTYGGRVQSGEKIHSFVVDNATFDYRILCEIREFFRSGEAPVSMQETLEVQAILDAAERSTRSGQSEELQC